MGMLLVAAAGNSGLDNDVTPAYPASFDLDNVLAVAALDNEGIMAGFSNYGLQSVDVSAPGFDVAAAATVDGPSYTTLLIAGTSPAAANVSGVAALIGSVQPQLLNASALKERILATGKPVHLSRDFTLTGRMPDAQAALAVEPRIVRLAGSDRYATAAQISAATYFRYPGAVMIATGATFPDALSGGAVAAQFGFPLLLVAQNSIPPATADELTRLKPQNIIVLGGPGVVSDEVGAQLASYVLSGGVVVRWAGADRFATSAVISFNTFPAGIDTAYITTGLNFPDALAAAPPSALSNGPLLLVRPTAIPPVIVAELDSLQPGRIVILGGPGVVSNSVAAQLDAYTTGPVLRIAGPDRYQTATATSAAFYASAETVYVATGKTFPDALAGGSAGGQFLGPLLLVPGTSVPPSVAGELVRFDPARIFILGGPGVVSDGVIAAIDGLFP
jgi:putative cell wall-binding protein